MKKNSFVEGTLVAYTMILITKLLGAVYVIPFYKIIGTSGGVLYSYAYNVYNLFLNISTSGIPTAVSIIIAEYNTLKLFNEREKAFKVANKVISCISFIAFIIMFTFAGSLGNFFVKDLDGATNIESIKLVIRTISFCLLVIPFLSVTRGYLQGNKYVANSSVSQLIEQVVRIAVVLIGSYVAINLLHFSVPVGVSFALSGTVLGGLAAFLYLKYKIHKNKADFRRNVTSIKDANVKESEIIKKIIMYAIPIIIVSITQNIYDMIDMKLILKGLYMIGYGAKDCEYIASIIVTWTPKICMIINALATGLCTSIIPFVVSSFVKKDFKALNDKFNQAVNTILFISIPLAAFLIIYSKPVYYIFYGESIYGPEILCILSIISIVFSIQLVSNMMLQGMKRYKIVYLNTIAGVIVNSLLDIPMILLLNKINFKPYLGTIIATLIGGLISIMIIFIVLKRRYKFKYRHIWNVLTHSLINTFFAAIIMFILKVILFDKFILYKLLVKVIHSTYIITFFELGVCGLLTLGFYTYLTNRIGLVDKIFGKNTIERVLIKLKIKKIEEEN